MLKTPDRSLFSESHNPNKHDTLKGGGPRVVSTAAFHARVRGSVPGLRRWPNIKTSLFQRVVFAGSTLPVKLIHSCGAVLGLSASAALAQL